MLVVDDPSYGALLAPHRGAPLPDVEVAPSDVLLLLFTSGTSGAPKAVITSSGRLLDVGRTMTRIVGLTADDVTYISMPLFHSNALFTAWAPSIVAGAAVALRRTFSASGFLPDVRRYGATYFNYVGRPLAYILATPELPDDADNTLRRGLRQRGERGRHRSLRRALRVRADRRLRPDRDGCGDRARRRHAGRRAGCRRFAVDHGAQSGHRCGVPACGVRRGRQAAERRGGHREIVNEAGGKFEGYWRNDEANAERLRHGAYWTGDLAYRDDAGFFYFAGRSADWIRVDGENFAGAPVERILHRFPGVVLAAAYGVPDPALGDRLMATMQMAEGAAFDPEAFASFLAEQPDLGPKWVADLRAGGRPDAPDRDQQGAEARPGPAALARGRVR